MTAAISVAVRIITAGLKPKSAAIAASSAARSLSAPSLLVRTTLPLWM